MYQFHRQFCFCILFLAQMVQYSYTIFPFNLFKYLKLSWCFFFLLPSIPFLCQHCHHHYPLPSQQTPKLRPSNILNKYLQLNPTVMPPQVLKPLTVSEWKCSQCSYRNDEEISRAVFGGTNEGG